VRLRLAITAFFLLSGATGLVYQVIWVRLLGLIVGHSVLAISTVVATFMAGLGIGARLAGGRAERSTHPLVVYGLLEVGIGVLAALSPIWLGMGTSLFHALGAGDGGAGGALSLLGVLLVAVLILLPPTLAMGATLPLLTRWYARDEQSLGLDMGWLYAINTTGAVGGAAMAGFVLLPGLGQPVTLALAAAVNVAVGLSAVWLGRQHPLAPSREPSLESAPWTEGQGALSSPKAEPGDAKAVLWAFALSGAAAMVNQVAWSRSFELFVGSTTYAFSLIVCAFIAGLALGGHVFARIVDRSRDRVALLASVNVGIALAGAVLIPLLGELPLLFLRPVAALSGSFLAMQLFTFGALFAVVLLPTSLMGATYPVATRALVVEPEHAASAVGRAYGWNTAGAVLGAVCAGMVMVPWLQLRGTLWLAVSLNLAAAAVLLGPRRSLSYALPLLGVLGMVATPDWNPRHMNLAPHMYARDLVDDPDALRSMRDQGSVLFHEEGMGATVTVLQRPEGARVLRINGKTDASTQSDRLGQGFLGHLPMLLARERRSALMIGLGSGMSLGSVLSHPVGQLKVVELLPEVHRAAAHFDALVGGPLADSRTEVVLGDGRQVLLYGDQKYDAVISQPTNLFVSGISSLFTVEAFEAMQQALHPGGVAAVWLQGYLLPSDDFKTICRTFQEVFPEASLWNAGPFDYYLVGRAAAPQGNSPTLPPTQLAERLAETAESLAGQWTGLRELVDLQRHFLLGPLALRSFVGAGLVQRDNDPFLEFSVPRGLYGGQDLLDVSALLERRETVPIPSPIPEFQLMLASRLKALGPIERAALGSDLGALLESEPGDPGHPFLRERKARLLHEDALSRGRSGELEFAELAAREVSELAPDSLPAWRLRSFLRHLQGDSAGAIAMLQAAVEVQPWNVYAHLALARYLEQEGRTEEALVAYEVVRGLDPELPELATP